MDTVLAPYANRANIALFAIDAVTGQVWDERRPDEPQKPASVLKLFVTAAALDRLGPEFEFETSLHLLGDELLVIGGGDPGFGDERIAAMHQRPHLGELSFWARRLREEGVTRLTTIALDDSIFDRQHRHPDWPNDQAAAWYQAPVGGLNLNDNCIDAAIDITNARIALDLKPSLPAAFLDSKLAVGKAHEPRVTRRLASDIFEFRGSIAHSENLGSVSVGDPTVFFGYALRQELEVHGIDCGERVVRRDITPEQRSAARVIAVNKTSLRDALWRANTFSQNMFAECLLKSLAAYDSDGSRTGRPGSWQAGHAVLRRTLGTLGVNLDGAALRDGSGLSHDNRVTARQIVTLLKAMQSHRYADVFLGSLARAGRSGSMERRYADPQLVGRLIGKTGTISGVRTLAGLLTRDDGGTLIFALLVDGDVPPDLPAAVCKALGGY